MEFPEILSQILYAIIDRVGMNFTSDAFWDAPRPRSLISKVISKSYTNENGQVRRILTCLARHTPIPIPISIVTRPIAKGIPAISPSSVSEYDAWV